MHVLFLIWNFWPGIEGGSERQARQISAELARRGYSCTIWTALLDRDLPLLEEKDGTTIVRFGRWVPWLSRFCSVLEASHRFLRKILQKIFTLSDNCYSKYRSHFDFWVLLPFVYIARWSFMTEVRKQAETMTAPPDIIHLHEPSWLGGFAVELGRKLNVPVLCQEATNPALPVLGYDVPQRRLIEKNRREAHFIAMAPYLRDDLLEKNVPSERIHVIPNGVKIPLMKEKQQEMPIVLYVGNFTQGAHWKGFDILFDAWHVIHEKHLDLRLVVLGGGDRSIWEDYVAQLGCADTVDFMGRVNEPAEFYRKAAIFVLPSRVEGMSNALLEAQSWGVPCIVSDIPGNTSIVEDGVNGIVVQFEDSGALASAIINLYNNERLRKRIGNAAREHMISHYDHEKIVEKLITTYDRICCS